MVVGTHMLKDECSLLHAFRRIVFNAETMDSILKDGICVGNRLMMKQICDKLVFCMGRTQTQMPWRIGGSGQRLPRGSWFEVEATLLCRFQVCSGFGGSSLPVASCSCNQQSHTGYFSIVCVWTGWLVRWCTPVMISTRSMGGYVVVVVVSNKAWTLAKVFVSVWCSVVQCGVM